MNAFRQQWVATPQQRYSIVEILKITYFKEDEVPLSESLQMTLNVKRITTLGRGLLRSDSEPATAFVGWKVWVFGRRVRR